jgi:hypothetical protein
MPLINGRLTDEGAIVEVVVAVSPNREVVLRRAGFPVPHPIHVRAVIDTGSHACIFQPSLFRALGLTRIGTVPVRTPSTAPGSPHHADWYDVRIGIVCGPQITLLGNFHALAAEDFLPDEYAQAIVGRDLLARCDFAYQGRSRAFSLDF